MATLEPELLEALNGLLEDERACVELELALANGATEIRERTAFTAMGSCDVLACCALRERLTDADAEVTWRINGVVLEMLGMERYDERLRAFAQYLAAIADSVRGLLAQTRDREAQKVLEEIHEAHVRDAVWCERRAEEFAQSRFLDFRVSSTGTRNADGGTEATPETFSRMPQSDHSAAMEDERETGTKANDIPTSADGARSQPATPRQRGSQATTDPNIPPDDLPDTDEI